MAGMSDDRFKQRVERSSLGARTVTAARVRASRRTAQQIVSSAARRTQATKTDRPEKSS